MDLALETGTTAQASHRIVCEKLFTSGGFFVQERRKFLWIIPYWHTLHTSLSLDAAEAWLKANWKVPAYFHITRKNTP